ncbi:MAG: ABC transporter ATP-binding protein, partial [Rhizobacter sp.]|nr:ABC transporter ATP-binding protein [Chlorobiales bacterium]
PQLILADEPTANLDEASSDLVITLLKKVCSESGRMLILVTHEREVAAALPRTLELKSVNQIS